MKEFWKESAKTPTKGLRDVIEEQGRKFSDGDWGWGNEMSEDRGGTRAAPSCYPWDMQWGGDGFIGRMGVLGLGKVCSDSLVADSRTEGLLRLGSV